MNEFLLKDLLEIQNGRDHKDLRDGNIPVFGSGGLMRFVDTAIYDQESIYYHVKAHLQIYNIQINHFGQ